jgi:hypothetical protein
MYERSYTSPKRSASRRAMWAAAFVVLALASGPFAAAAGRAEQAPAFLIVVNVRNPEPSVTREFLADAFLKKTTRWPSGEPLRPVDQRYDSSVRSSFSEGVLLRSAAAIRSYWQQRIFSGRGVPPPELETDADVLRYVQQNPGAVGYVSGRTAPGEVKVLTVR